MLVFSAIVPHPPIAIPGVGKENQKKLHKTLKALEILARDFELAKPDLVIVISPHGDIYPDAFTINTLPEYEANFHQFGDFETQLNFSGDISFINRFKEQVESRLAVNLKSNELVDHGISIPLYFLSRNYSDFKIVPITYSFLSYEKHLQFGEELKEAIVNSDKRIAVIASGDLSHRLSLKAPGGFSPQAKDFDKKLVQILKKQQVEGLLNMDSQMVKDAGECGLRSFIIMTGIMKDYNYDFQVLSYEAPFGVGYLTAEYKLA